MEPVVIAVCNEKGGSAKTTTCAALTHLFAQRTRDRVVAIDMDPQASLTQHLLARSDTGQGMLDVLGGRLALDALLVPVPSVDGARIAPSGKLVARAENDGRLMPGGGQLALRLALRKVDADVILLDTPPTNPHLLNVALAAADVVLSPVQPESACVKGLAALTHTIDQMQLINPRVRLVGIVPSLVKRRRSETERVLAWLRQTYGTHVFGAEVRDSADIPPSDRKALPPTLYRPSGNGAQDLVRVFWELQERLSARAA